jgi:N6-L-threonylcarbamoyladenine synthase
MTLVLGIETSCDETGIALYDSNKGILANTLYSQIELHSQYGGVVPELASRDHVRKITPLINECFNIAKVNKHDIDAIAYTCGPGLNGALLIGASVANGLAFSLNKPAIPIHHLEGHLLSPFLGDAKPTLPFIALLVSGGHSQIIAVYAIGKYIILGDTLDDAAGEAFDKTAKMLNLPYPGGKYIAELATKGQPTFKLPRPMITSKNLQMSFSGLKTAVAILIKQHGGVENIDQQTKCNIACSIEEAITDVLLHKSKLAITQTGINTLVVSGGVSCNLTLRNKLNTLTLDKTKRLNPKIPNANITNMASVNVFYPPLEFCTDNGAMIALAGAVRHQFATYDYSYTVNPRYLLTTLAEMDT